MKRFSLVLCILVASAAILSATPLPPSSAVVLVNGSPLYEEQSGKTLKALDYLTLGDVVTLLNRTGTFKENGTDRDFTRIKAMNGKEGWVRTQFIGAKASIAVVKADQAIVYSEAREVKITSKYLNALTLVAVLQDGSTPSFAKVQGYDVAQKYLFADGVFVSMDDLTSADADVNAAILYDVAMATKDPTVKKNLLKIAAAKYSGSVFYPKIQTAQGVAPAASQGGDAGADAGGDSNP